ncbi:hypothetical protein HPP92_024642 [Vanilla planifolia]|nr:hypothetical protein HPP92_024642 [Vanilla planifolia]
MAGNAAAQGGMRLVCDLTIQPCLKFLVTQVVPPFFDQKRCCVTLSGFVANKECFCSFADNDQIPKDKVFKLLVDCGISSSVAIASSICDSLGGSPLASPAP